MEVTLHYSPDADDSFMFWALRHGRIDPEGYTFLHHQQDTEALNRLAATGKPDVCAVSLHQYAYLTEQYVLLPHGGSVGRGYGPVVVAREPVKLADLEGKRVGTPGRRTTAHLVLTSLLPDFEAVDVPIAPFRAAFEALASGKVDAVLLIHEGRLLYQKEGLHLVVDIGQAWEEEMHLPLPLGVNVIRKDLEHVHQRAISRLIGESIGWGLRHQEEVVDAILQENERTDFVATRQDVDTYLGMYANSDTAEYKADVREAIRRLFQHALHKGLLSQTVRAEYAPQG